MPLTAVPHVGAMLTLPGDAVRQILWRFADRFDLQMLVQSARAVARGPVARMVAAGERNTHEWTPAKDEMMKAFDRAGITSAFMEPEEGGFISGPKNLALALSAFELAWVDGGAATASLASCLALAPIRERGTAEQSAHYMAMAAPGEDRPPRRGAASLRGRGHRDVERAGAHRRVEGWRRTDAAGGEARALHHQYCLRELCDRGSGFGRRTDQG